MLLGPSSRGSLLLIHKASFVVWIGVTAVHVFGHLQDLPRALSAKYEIEPQWQSRATDGPGGTVSRRSTYCWANARDPLHPQFGPWLHAHH